MTPLYQIKVLDATHQSTLYYIYIFISHCVFIYIYIWEQIYYFNINLQGNIHYIVTAEISAQIDHCHT